MKFRPLHDRDVIRRAEGDVKSKRGIMVPDAAKAEAHARFASLLVKAKSPIADAPVKESSLIAEMPAQNLRDQASTVRPAGPKSIPTTAIRKD